MLISVLLLGFLIGMQHAFEADHLAAVSTLLSRRRDPRSMIRQGAIWGLGHTLALLVVSGVVLFSPWALPPAFEPALELAVGLLLAGLGAHLLYRLRRDCVHIHVHRHPDGDVHLHAHSHRGEAAPHEESAHRHEHSPGGWKTLIVGLAHGTAGSAALTVYVVASLESPVAGLVYVLLFGLGSILGMALLSAVIAVPLTMTARRLTRAHRAIQIVVALVSIAIGLRLAAARGVALWW